MKQILVLFFTLIISWNMYGQAVPKEIEALFAEYSCNNCHKLSGRLVGPGYVDIMNSKHYTAEQIVQLIYAPKPRNWPGYPPMVPVSWMPRKEALKVAVYISGLVKKPALSKNM